MLILLSPAKTLDYSTPYTVPFDTLPEFIVQSEQLIKRCQQFTPADLALLMHISDKLAGLNAARFAQWTTHFDHQNSRPAIFAFNGDVYDGFNVADFNHDDLQFAQQHLRILSGLYGVLRPLDLMQPYRLEMGTPLKNAKGKDLYAFWQSLLTEKINTLLATTIKDNTLINLASDEYYKALNSKKIQANIVKPVFLDEKNGKYKVISFYAKKARGAMARFIIKERLTDCEQIKDFNDGGYCFDESLSDSTQWVFKRSDC